MSIEIPDFSRARVLVVGDVMLDRYWYGPTGRISPEAPVPVVRVTDSENRPGGAGNVALNITALGCRAVLVGIVGADDTGRQLEEQLGQAGVECRFVRQSGISTITKLRVISRQQQLIRLDFEDDASTLSVGEVMPVFKDALAACDVVVFSDYNKGTLKHSEQLIAAARDAGKMVLVDPKHVDLSRYRNATVITPNQAEFEAATGVSRFDDQQLDAAARKLISTFGFEAVLVTRGEHGMTLVRDAHAPQSVPTHAREVYDVTGAGDTVISVLAASLAVGLDMHTATMLSNFAAGVAVGKLGTATVTADELQVAVHEHHAARQGVLDEGQLVSVIESARAQGESIVMTNGCFDILHAGHVTYLEEASRLGDRLIVAVNIDETVRALKGDDRPVNPVEARMAVLAALGCVDWVVPFVEETPERLICAVRPDVLVKGGDNDPDRIPGNRCVREAGGEVRVLSYVDGVSTTHIVRSIREKS